MNRLQLCGRHELAQFEDCGFSHMISIGDSRDSFEGLRLGSIAEHAHLILRFEDVHDAEHPDAPSPVGIAPLFSWLEKTGPMKGLLIHCMAGLGRSPAVALLTLCALDPETAPATHLETVVAAAAAESSDLMPNILVARVGEQVLSRSNDISAAVIAWRDAHGIE